MPRFTRVLLRTVFALLAFIVMIGLLLYIAYSYELYTPSAKEPSTLIAITGATLIDGTGDPPQSNTTLIIGGDKILSIEADGQIPKGARVLAAADIFVLPGLIDAAVLFEAPAGQESNYLSGEWGWEITRALPNHRRNALDAGITTIQDVGSSLDSILRLRTQLANGELAGPRLYTSGPILKASAGYPNEELFPFRLDITTHSIPNPEEAQQWAQTLAGSNVDLISVSYNSLGGRFPRPDQETLKALIQEAHAFGRIVIVNTSSLEEAKEATAAGADVLLGGVTLAGELVDGELLNLMAQSGTRYIPALFATQVRGSEVESLESAQNNVRLVYQAGVPLVAGSGTAGTNMDYGDSLHIELQLLVEAGIDPMMVLQMATYHAAQLLEPEQDLGLLEENYPADLLIVQDNPLENMRALEETLLVMQNGSIVVNYLPEP